MVLDANLVLKWILTKDEQLVEEARSLHDIVISGKVRALAPELLLIEVVNLMFWKKEFKKEDILEFLRLLRDGRISFVGWEKFEMEDLLSIMDQYRVTIYDAYYIAVAIKNKCKLVSLDRKLERSEKYLVKLEDLN